LTRIYNYWLSGKDNYAAGRKAAEEAVAAYPGVATGAGPTGHSSPGRYVTGRRQAVKTGQRPAHRLGR
jgi:ABC-type sugar transport system substrate-binding protein